MSRRVLDRTIRLARTPVRPLSILILAVAALTTLVAPSSAQPNSGDKIEILKSTSRRMVYDVDLLRGAVGDPDIVELIEIDSREYLARGLEIGQTNVIMYFEDGSTIEHLIAVVMDLTALRTALQQIDPSLSVSMAPDREAVILSGEVGNLAIRMAAEDVAERYISSRRRSSGRGSGETLVGRRAGQVPTEGTEPTEGEQSVQNVESDLSTSSVINLITVRELPSLIEDRVREAIGAMGGENVTVRRVLRGQVPDDIQDILILEGTVANQIALTRVLSVVSRLFLGEDANARDLRVIADESGGLIGVGSGDSASAITSIARSNQSSGGGGGGGGQGGARAVGESLIESNIARSTAIEIAGGRILAFIEVEDIPQVRVQIKLFEVNRNELLTYNAEGAGIGSDFDQGTLNPATGATAFQGNSASRVGTGPNEDVQNVLSFLGGTLRDQFQVAGEHFAIDTAFNLLETKGIARAISQPSLTVLSGEVAAFRVGGSVPITNSVSTEFGQQGALLSNVTFQQFGVILAARPLVGEDDMITLDLYPDVSQPDLLLTSQIRDASGATTDSIAFSERVLATTMRLNDGDAMIIAGLTSWSTSDSESSPPILGDIPLLGWLFKSVDKSDDEKDLVIVVYPSIVREPNPDSALWAWADVQELMDAVRDPEAARRLAGDRPALEDTVER